MDSLAAQLVPAGQFYIVWCRDADAATLARLLAGGPIPREQPADPACAYLTLPITKPWGYELKFYEDALSEAWLLAIQGGSETSMHAHPRKATILVCVDGEGWLTTGDGERIELVTGTVVLIMPGARHRTSTSAGLWLVEFESPKDKFDLVRCSDATRLPLSGYEGAAAAGAVAGARAVPLVELAAGPPLARLRDRDVDGRYRFDVESGAELKDRPAGLRVAISLAMGSILRREFAVVTESGVADAADDVAHLTIRKAPGD